MSKTLAVAAIQYGTVIDHIPAGQAFRILHLLHLLNQQYKITVGLNLPSKQMHLKDLIKIEDYELKNNAANEITIFAPLATINIIKDFEVVDKIITSLPEGIANVFICPNQSCITHAEPVESYFMIEAVGKDVKLLCKYCEKMFDRNHAKVKI